MLQNRTGCSIFGIRSSIMIKLKDTHSKNNDQSEDIDDDDTLVKQVKKGKKYDSKHAGSHNVEGFKY